TLLGREGFEVVRCREGTEALRAAMANPFSLWILDLHQEASPGRSLLLDLRKAWRAARVPALLLAAPGSDRDLARGFELGADDYLIKPFSPYDLTRSEEHTSELQSRENLVCRLLLEKKKILNAYT